MTGLKINDEDNLDSDMNRRRLDQDKVFVYIDPSTLLFKPFHDDGAENELGFGLKRIINLKDHDSGSEYSQANSS